MGLMVSWIAYLMLYDPFFEKQDTNKEIFNSVMLMMFLYFIPAFTFMTNDPTHRYFLGFITIFIFGGLLLTNLVWLIVSVIQDNIKQKFYKRIVDEKVKERKRK
jgi:hypothetical protein